VQSIALLEMNEDAAVALGSNLGNRSKELIDACSYLRDVAELCACSSVYENQPQGFRSDRLFLNAVVHIRYVGTPFELLQQLVHYEHIRGRKRSSGYSDRPIDLDLIAFGQVEIQTEELTLPHPRWKERSFVKQPLADLGAGHIWTYMKEELNEVHATGELIKKELRLC
jgi:2-amino-4-hydroxy-6-hydroxymethyldihydropteridine diphosphokinase